MSDGNVLDFTTMAAFQEVKIVMPDKKEFTLKPVSFKMYQEAMKPTPEDEDKEDVYGRLLSELAQMLEVPVEDLEGYDIRVIMAANRHVHERLREQSAAADPTPAEAKK